MKTFYKLKLNTLFVFNEDELDLLCYMVAVGSLVMILISMAIF